MTETTPYADVNRVLDALLAEMRRVLGERLVAVYLYGSLVTGDFDPGISDIDLLAVTTSAVEYEEAERLREMHERFARENPAWDNRVEVAYVSTEALRTFRERSSEIAVISPGEPFHLKEAGNDWLINWWVVREKGVALFGPPPGEVIPPISKDEFLRAVRVQADHWGDWVSTTTERKAQAYAILTMCRALYAATNAEQVSKRQAALWAMKELPEWAGQIERALEWRAAVEERNVDPAATYGETVEFVRFARGRILAA